MPPPLPSSSRKSPEFIDATPPPPYQDYSEYPHAYIGVLRYVHQRPLCIQCSSVNHYVSATTVVLGLYVCECPGSSVLDFHQRETFISPKPALLYHTYF